MDWLTEEFVLAAQPMSVTYEVFDEVDEALSLRVYADGEKEFIYRYKFLEPGMMLCEGRPADCTLSEARVWGPRAVARRESPYDVLARRTSMADVHLPVSDRRHPTFVEEKPPAINQASRETIWAELAGGLKEALLKGLLGPKIYAGLREHRRTGRTRR